MTNKSEWGHCPGEENPADIGSRGTSATRLKESKLWWGGPEWLLKDKEGWPAALHEEQRTPESLEEEKKTVAALTVAAESHEDNVVDVDKYSSFERLVRVTAWVKRFANNSRASRLGKMKVSGSLSVRELIDSEGILIVSAQNKLRKQPNFQQLVNGLGLKSEDGILRCQGRLLNSDLEDECRKPIILPREHQFTRLIIRDSHVRVHHGGVRATLADVRSRFWIPKGRQYVKRLLNKCTVCERLTGKPYKPPETTALPEFRVRQSPPFNKVGVYFAGPLYVKTSKTMRKVYIALFSCCVTQALHLELVEDLTPPAFRRCLRRFTAARGTPSMIISDNAKTFKAVSKSFKQLFSHPEVRSDLEVQRIQWRFNLERAPWWGGFFERMVRM